jgi:hypothetical protein
MTGREDDPTRAVLDIEAAYTAKLAKHELTIMAREDARHRRRLAALGPATSRIDPTGFAPGCLIDDAPYPYLGNAA